MQRAFAFLKQNKIAVSIVVGITALATFLYFQKTQPEIPSSIKVKPSRSQVNQQVEQRLIVAKSLKQRSQEKKEGDLQLTELQRKQCKLRSSLVEKTQYHSQDGSDQEIRLNCNSIKTEEFRQKYADLKCCITLQLMKQPYKLPCGHIFENVVIEHVQKYADCPVCKKQTRVEDLTFSERTKYEIEEFKKKVGRKGSEWTSQRDAEIDYLKEIQGQH